MAQGSRLYFGTLSPGSFSCLTAPDRNCLESQAASVTRPPNRGSASSVPPSSPFSRAHDSADCCNHGRALSGGGGRKAPRRRRPGPLRAQKWPLPTKPLRSFKQGPILQEDFLPPEDPFVDMDLEDYEDALDAADTAELEEAEEGSRVFSATEERLVNNDKMLQINKADYTVSSILDKISRAKLDLKPAYQRDYVWDKKTASKLIESLLLNIPVPTMFFHEKERGKLEVVDGKQRLTSIWSFMVEERFPDGTPFALSGLEVLRKLNTRRYSDLSEDLKEALQDYALNVHTISRHSDEDVVFEVFERLNMGSTQLNEQELRNCIYQGAYTAVLEELVLDGYMLLAMRADAPHKRMRDRELILRFFAMRSSGVDKFVPPIKTWLNEEMRLNMDMSPATGAAMKADFERCLKLAVEVFGQEHVFRVLKPGLRRSDEPKWESDLNVALWDTVMHGFLKYNKEDAVLSARTEIKKALVDLMTKDAEFRQGLVSSKKALCMRWQKWDKALGKAIGSRAAKD